MSPFRLFLHFAPITVLMPALVVGYIGWRLIAPTPLRGPTRRAAYWALLLPWLVVLLSLMYWREREVGALRLFLVAGFGLLGYLLMLFALLLVRDIAALLVRAIRAATAFGSRHSVRSTRVFRWSSSWENATNVAVLLLAAVLTGLGVAEAHRAPAVVTVPVRLGRLPPGFARYRIAQVSDIHASGLEDRNRLAELAARVNALGADLIALTGDVVDGPQNDLRSTLAPLGRLRARDGVFAILGNHEYYADADACVSELRRLGFTVLLNEHRVIERGSAKLVVAGVTNPHRGMHGTHLLERPTGVARLRSDPMQALRGAPAGAPRILLAHQPASAAPAQAAGCDLVLAGHTHGGGFLPWSLLAPLVLEHVSGLAKLGSLQRYVSRGIGTFGPPLRLGVPPEMALIELR
ncbi:MAG: metallophosphoesterase [Polyangiaceae bacterium]|nr:metallophosphoesterase [Polyangiaceae bacterium]